MNIAIFASSFHPHFGGVEELVRQLALELGRQRHDVIVLTNRWPRTLPRHEIVEGIPVYRLPFRAPDAGVKSVITFQLSRAAIEREVASILWRHSIDVIHVQCVSSNGYYALRASQALRLPLVVTLQGELTMDSTKLFERSAFARQTLRDCMATAEVVTACSNKTLEDGERFFGQPLGARGRVIFNGVSIGDFCSTAPLVYDRPYVLAIGRLVREKGFDILLRAFAEANVPTHYLVLAGDGPERVPLSALAAELKLENRVKFLGRANRATVPGLFAGSDFLVLPSRSDEGLPVVTVEAMAAAKAIVATRSGGTPEAVLDGITGLIVEKEDVAQLAAAIRRLCLDAALRNRLAETGRRRAEQFGWPHIVQQYVTCYEKAIKSKSALEVLQGSSTGVAGITV
jgi:glycosyltransferase involved in cell wall biosynthesis